MTYINSVLSTNNYQYTKVFQCDMSSFTYTNSLTNIMTAYEKEGDIGGYDATYHRMPHIMR